jgi:CHAT domain-containing protein/Tfp pilus assembly protein PilF
LATRQTHRRGSGTPIAVSGAGFVCLPPAPLLRILAFLLSSCLPAFPQPTTVPGTGLEVTRNIEPGTTHVYSLKFEEARHCVRAVLDQRGVDLFVEFRSGGGSLLYRLDSRWHGAESLVLIPPTPADYLLEVKRISTTGSPGTYSLKIQAPRPVQDSDERALAAQRLATRLKELVSRGTAESHREALSLAPEAAAAWREAGDLSGQAQARNTLGFLLNAVGRSAEALKEYAAALELWRAAGDRSGQAETLHNMAAAKFALGERETALADYELALPHRRASGDVSGEGATLANIGRLYQAIGRSHQALESLSQALQLQRRAGNVAGELQCLIGLGTLHAQRGELQRGLNHLTDALPLLEKGGDLRGYAYTLVNLGKLYADLGESEQGLRRLRDAASRMREVGDKRGEAAAFQRIGAILLAHGDAAGALENCERALALAEEVSDPSAAAMALTTMARAHEELGKRALAIDFGQRALRDLEALQDSRGAAVALHLLGVLYYRDGNPEAAFDYFQRAVDSWQTDSPSRAGSLYWWARVEYAMGRVEQAREHAHRSVEIVEASRSGMAAEHLLASYIASRYHYYEFYIDVLMALDRADPNGGWDVRAFEVSERARARALLEALAATRPEIREGIAHELQAKEIRLRREINALAARAAEPMGGPGARRDAESKLGALLAELAAVEAEIRRRSPRFASLTQPETLSLERIQREVLDEETILLEYALGEERSYLWVAGTDFLKSFHLPGRTVIETLTAELRRLLSHVEERGETATWRQEWATAAGPLAAAILKPAARLLSGKRLLIVADGPLHYVPFDALPLAEGPTSDFLTYEMVRVPSASILVVSRAERARRASPTKTVAIFADPVYDAADPRISPAPNRPAASAKAPDEASRPRRLPFTRQEALRISALVPSGELFSRIGFAANRSAAVDARLRDYRIVHFAAHAIIDDSHPELSGIALSLVDGQGRTQDGFLRLHDIYNLSLPADLVVLSACQSALGTHVRGEGMMGLTRGFMYAGAARVLASLSKVHDEATAELMALFYRNMLRLNLTPAAALRDAQRELARRRRWAHPFYWAGFTLHGDWR